MKRLLMSVAGLSLITGLTFAQMRGVPPGHWAYQSIEQLVQLGIIEGYPDGTFRPNRTMTRAEFAQAIARAYRNIDERLRALDRRINEINRPQVSEQQPPTDTSGLQRQIEELRKQIDELKKLNEAIQTLQRLAQTFQQELAGLGVDVDTLKRDFASLRARVEALEGKEEKFKMSGDLTFGVYGAHSIDGKGCLHLQPHDHWLWQVPGGNRCPARAGADLQRATQRRGHWLRHLHSGQLPAVCRWVWASRR
jgi:peptidoglycan hydrolase CwlO-like protein